MKPTLAFEKKYLIITGIAFSLCSLPVITLAQTLDFGKSYYNVTKAMSGGTVETGDVLEIRATITVKAGAFDSCGFFDFIPSGTSYIPGTIRVLTNEGKIYKQFTDASDDDCGWINGSVVRINLGYSSVNGATSYRRGRVASNHKPSLYGSSCIMLASYRVTVTAALNSTLNLGSGWFSYQTAFDPVQLFLFTSNMVKVYPNTAIGTTVTGTNMFGAESNGSFGMGKSRNRTASSLMSPAFAIQPLDIGTPFDMAYAIVNNSSTRSNYTTSNSWAKPDNSFPTHRVFGLWDIIGDHTGSTTAYGNAAADTVVSNNGGYMLVVNGAYRNDSILQRTVTGLCPGTVYEITAWFRNLCSKCGCDSNGTGAIATSGPLNYIPTGVGDSSGVHPNIAFEINGIDHYNTGDLLYTGAWVKKGFTYQTGASQTSFILRFSNNTTGGGGNDWAMDDISVASIGPVMSYSPNNITAVCSGNPIMLYDTVRSGFNAYAYYQWQRSTNNGSSWTTVTPVTGPATPVQVGATWEYVASYQVPPSDTEPEDSADQYRVIVASSAGSLTGPSCRFTDPINLISLQILECGIALENNLLSFSGRVADRKALLEWTVAETDPCLYIVERSINGIDYYPIAQVRSKNNGAPENNYTYSDPLQPGNNFYYRIQVRKPDGHANFSRTIRLALEGNGLFFVRVVNPFATKLQFDLHTDKDATASVSLINAAGITVQQRTFKLRAGTNQLQLDNVAALPSGVYFLACRVGNELLRQTVFKQNNNTY